jgi:hypothetical protein
VLSFRRILLAVAFLINASFVLAQFPVDLNHPSNDAQPAQMRELVSKYCRLDYEGVSLDPQSWSKIQPLVWWKSSPEYTQIDVVSRYTVDSEPESKNGKYVAEVHYRLLGIYDLATGYVPEPGGATQNTYPHPSRAAMLKWLNDKISTTPDEAAKTRYQDALQQLQAQSASPFAK